MIEVSADVWVIDLEARRHGIVADDWAGVVSAVGGGLAVIRYGGREGTFSLVTGEHVDFPGRVFRTIREYEEEFGK